MRHMACGRLITGFLTLLVLAGVSCGDGSDGEADGADASSGLTGEWLTTPEFDDVTMSLRQDESFEWDNRSLGTSTSGTRTADTETLTFSFAEGSRLVRVRRSHGSTSWRVTP